MLKCPKGTEPTIPVLLFVSGGGHPCPWCNAGAYTSNQHLALRVSMTDLGEQPVEMVTRKIRQDGNKEGILVYGYTKCTTCKFRPVMQ